MHAVCPFGRVRPFALLKQQGTLCALLKMPKVNGSKSSVSIRVRHAAKEDRTSILDIIREFPDYPFDYEKLAKCRNTTRLVAEINNSVVS